MSRCLCSSKLAGGLTYHEDLSPIETHYPWVAWSCEITWQIQNIISLLPLCLLPPKLAGNYLVWGTLIHRVIGPLSHVVLQYHLKDYICTNAMPMATKCGRVVTFNNKLPPTKSNDPQIIWSCKVMWQITYVISAIAIDQWLPNMAMWWFIVTGLNYKIT